MKGIQWNVWSEVYGGSKDDLRKPEGLGLISPASFQQLEDFDNESNLEVFKCSYREEINYKTTALHISAHMFFERIDLVMEK